VTKDCDIGREDCDRKYPCKDCPEILDYIVECGKVLDEADCRSTMIHPAVLEAFKAADIAASANQVGKTVTTAPLEVKLAMLKELDEVRPSPTFWQCLKIWWKRLWNKSRPKEIKPWERWDGPDEPMTYIFSPTVISEAGGIGKVRAMFPNANGL